MGARAWSSGLKRVTKLILIHDTILGVLIYNYDRKMPQNPIPTDKDPILGIYWCPGFPFIGARCFLLLVPGNHSLGSGVSFYLAAGCPCIGARARGFLLLGPFLMILRHVFSSRNLNKSHP